MNKEETKNKDIKKRIKIINFLYSKIINPFRLAVASLKRNGVRTVLTILGIVIGISAVITVMSAGNGLREFMVGMIEMFGNDTIQTEIKVPSTSHVSTENAAGIAMGIQVTTLTLEDAQAVKELPNVRDNYSMLMGQEIISYAGESRQVLIWGADASFSNVDKTEVVEGRFFTEEEDKSHTQVIVIGQTIKEKIFNNQDPLGKLVKVGKLKFKVIGVMEKRGSMAFFDMDNFIYMPIRTLQKKVMGVDYIQGFLSVVYDVDVVKQTAEEIEIIMRNEHGITDPIKDDFAVMSMTEAIEIYDSVFGAINLLLIAISSISLIVGGVGIMNIMYVSVIERTYEIGLRKSVGATYSNILWQFLWEALIITFFGAIIGFVVGVILSFAISALASTQGLEWSFIISPASIVLAISFSAVIGVGFGIFPALAAAKLDPVDALRKK